MKKRFSFFGLLRRGFKAALNKLFHVIPLEVIAYHALWCLLSFPLLTFKLYRTFACFSLLFLSIHYAYLRFAWDKSELKGAKRFYSKEQQLSWDLPFKRTLLKAYFLDLFRVISVFIAGFLIFLLSITFPLLSYIPTYIAWWLIPIDYVNPFMIDTYNAIIKYSFMVVTGITTLVLFVSGYMQRAGFTIFRVWFEERSPLGICLRPPVVHEGKLKWSKVFDLTVHTLFIGCIFLRCLYLYEYFIEVGEDTHLTDYANASCTPYYQLEICARQYAVAHPSTVLIFLSWISTSVFIFFRNCALFVANVRRTLDTTRSTNYLIWRRSEWEKLKLSYEFTSHRGHKKQLDTGFKLQS